jgi:hypothetical protein
MSNKADSNIVLFVFIPSQPFALQVDGFRFSGHSLLAN